MRIFNWIGCIFGAGLGGCSLYPIPDDVSPYRTEAIVRYGRCEVRDAILGHMIRRGMITEQTPAQEIAKLIEATKKRAKIKAAKLTDNEEHLLRLIKVAVVYSFDFNITETNKAGADAGFRLPSLTSVVDAGATGALDLTRQGQRVFGTEDSWDDLMTNSKLCDHYPWRRPANIVYPLTGSIGFDPVTGSIGVGRVVETFIDIDSQGGAKDNFVDTLTFTTLASAGANASIKLDPVPNQFRLVSAAASVGASRQDIHKLTISLAFPHADPPQGGISGVVRAEGDLNAPSNAPFARPPVWRARYNLCVQDARTREAALKQLRLTDPLVYCISYADSFAPKYEYAATVAVPALRRRSAEPAAPAEPASPRGLAAPSGTVPDTIIRQPLRRNAPPAFVQ